jgi:hypothetical protein
LKKSLCSKEIYEKGPLSPLSCQTSGLVEHRYFFNVPDFDFAAPAAHTVTESLPVPIRFRTVQLAFVEGNQGSARRKNNLRWSHGEYDR